MKRILFGTDGSASALAAARHLSHLAHDRQVHVHIVTVLAVHTPENVAETLLNQAREALGNFPGHITSAMSRAESTGEIVDILIATAQYADVDLIAVGACGRSALDRFFIGSVAEGMARHADRPVLIARDSVISPLVIAGIDGSTASHEAARFVAGNLPKERSLHLVHVIAPPSGAVLAVDPVIAGVYYQAADQQITSEQEQLSADLGALRDELAIEGRQVTTQITIGNASAELIRVAEAQHAGLVVVGARGLTGIDRFLLGSVSERVVRHAPCSVLVYRSRQTAASSARP